MPPMAFTPRRHAGFTLIEMMITIGIFAVLIGLAVPSFNDSIRNNRVQTAANSLAVSVASARAEALRRSRQVSVCPSADGIVCGNDWGQGWMVYIEKPGVALGGNPDVESVLQVEAAKSSLQINQAAGNKWIRFSPRGMSAAPVSVSVSPKDCKAGYSYQEVEFGITGRAILSKRTC